LTAGTPLALWTLLAAMTPLATMTLLATWIPLAKLRMWAREKPRLAAVSRSQAA